jgi:maltose alpha-D-glucosyltransferase/alpha-amylase
MFYVPTSDHGVQMKKPGSAADPLWYKDAIIYEMHVRAFLDSNEDGVGDFRGLTQKLDYLQDLGVTCIWLLPFFASPLRDDGYDIADYLTIHPSYGTMEDFQAFLSAAHDRGLQVMIELVINHTSDRHAWFQRARQAPSGSPERDFYVWSDTDQKYKEARIIFTDTEKSNWTWDPVAQAYYWHRFFSHQPDLNFDNPLVIDEVLKIMRYWLDTGVDALRVDAIPYLVEREGTNCENLPETHAIIRVLRAEIDKEYAGRMMLAEANQWPTDVRPYFGNGDEFQMAFHFPLMPRIYMALRQEDRLPITDIMAQTPDIPETCQWGLFLRNHDELTLEMVTNDERDYMYYAYSADPRMRINLGIRRRLAPLMDNNRRRIELLNSLLFSFPGTPILYYGDEIGMGDNIYLGDRNGVRTPMQWNSDRNAGFSRATPGRLYSPVIMDAVWGYEAVNVEAQQSDPSSLLNWMRNMIALRKLFRVFGRGTLEFFSPANRKVLAYLRRIDDEQILCVANLSRFAQPVDLDLSELEGMTPIEMLGYVEFPPIGRQPYRITLGPYGFLWFELHGTRRAAQAEDAALPVAGGWPSLFEGAALEALENVALPAFLSQQPWPGIKPETMESARILDWAHLDGGDSALALVAVQYKNSGAETFVVPLAMAFDQKADHLRETAARAVVSTIVSGARKGILYDAIYDDEFRGGLLALVESGGELRTRNGTIRGEAGSALAELRRDGGGERLQLKLFRHFQSGPNPACEISRYLTDKAHFSHTAPFAGCVEYAVESTGNGSRTAMLGVFEGFVANEGDGWKWTTEELERYYENCARIDFPAEADSPELPDLLQLSELPTATAARDHVGIYLEAASKLGRRTAELHLALAAADGDPAFAPEPVSAAYMESLAADLQQQASQAFEALTRCMTSLPDELIDLAGLALSRRRRILDRFRALPGVKLSALRTRIHGDYHLGHILRVKSDYVILGFGGDPASPLAERRAKHSPLKDVASMLRSFSYAVYETLMTFASRRPENLVHLEPWAQLWDRSTGAEFLRAYRETAANAAFLPEADGFRKLLDAYLTGRALRELVHELNDRPARARIPLRGILMLSR